MFSSNAATGERKSTLVFCVSVAHVHALTQVFRGFGVDARYIYADTPAKERQTIIADFKAGLYPVLVNCGMLVLSHHAALCTL